MKLAAKVQVTGLSDPFMVRLTEDPTRTEAGDGRDALLVKSLPTERRSMAVRGPVFVASHIPIEAVAAIAPDTPASIVLPDELDYLADGDIVRVSPRASELRVLYRRASRFNSILLTERCNSFCLMCSQPPRDIDDGYLVDEAVSAIRLMAPDTEHLGITGGEPTLRFDGFLSVVAAARDNLPDTRLHVLTNGRLFGYLRYASELAALSHPRVQLGIPVYSDLPWRHDFVVQAQGAFDQTIRGLMNLARCGVSIELRLVLHAETHRRLPQFARFVARNLPFVDHVALMGLEPMGFARTNIDTLWVDPTEYASELREAVDILLRRRMNVSIYNHPLCLVDRELWPVARQSISDWKRIYAPCCEQCAVRDACGGLFASSTVRRSDNLRAVTEAFAAGATSVLAAGELERWT